MAAGSKILKSMKYCLKFVPDKTYLQLYYFAKYRKFINFKNPQTFNEKIQWLKLYDRNPLYTTLVDKVEVKNYVAGIIGEEFIIPTLGVWDNPEDINFNELPDEFVLKCNHDSGEVFICTDKLKFDKDYAVKRLKKLLSQDYYLIGREWPYKNVKRKVLAENYLTDESGTELKDYKIFNFGGEPKLIQVDYDRFTDHKRNLYTTDWKYIEATIAYPTCKDRVIEKPKRLEEMIELARKLSEGFPQVRTDFYSIDDKILFGEMTFYHGSGFEKFTPESLGVELGECIRLPRGGTASK